MSLKILIFALAVWLCGQAMAAPVYYRVMSVPNGKTFTLEGNAVVRMAAIQVPNVQEKDGAKRPGEPLGEEAKQALTELILDKKVRLRKTKVAQDRKGRILAQVYDEKGSSIQGEMLKRGMAYVYVFPDTEAKQLRDMLAYELAAREDRRGIWAEPYFAPIPAEKAGEYLNKQKIVVGKVLAVEERKGAVYLNFGEDWKTDFTVMIAKRSVKQFEGVDFEAWKDEVIEVRGWIEEKNGPMIEIERPEAVRITG